MAQSFRKSFQLVNKSNINWFPGHMGKGLRLMQQKIKSIDCVIEVHDARIPLAGRNKNLLLTLGTDKPHILVLNKKDLIPNETYSKIVDHIQTTEKIENIVFTNCKNSKCVGIQKLLPVVKNLISYSSKCSQIGMSEYNVMVIGVPNVGKSSVLNVLRNRHLKKRKASAVGAEAGITRSVLNRIKISSDPLIYVIDTPGILEPNIQDIHTGLKLAACGCLPDHIVGEDIIADYLLYWLNKNENFLYVELMGLKKPSDNIMEVLLKGARKLEKIKKIKNYDGTVREMPDFYYAARHLIRSFRNGYFGKLLLDVDHLRLNL